MVWLGDEGRDSANETERPRGVLVEWNYWRV
jgi:hypothetical protein